MRPLTNTRRRVLLTGLGLLGLGSLLAWKALPYGAQPLSTVAVTRADIESSVTALGTLQPRRYVDVGAQASGQIHKLHVEVGDSVRKGQLLVEIDPSTQQARLDAGRFSIDNLKAQLAEQRAQYLLAQQQLKRQRDLAAAGATRDEDVQTAAAQLKVTQARIDMFLAQIRQAQASLRSDEAELGYTRIYAPMDGTVVAVDAREGQTLNAQQQTPLILRIAKLSPMTVWAQVSEADIGKVKPGMTAYFTTLAGGKRRWTSTVRQVLPIPPKPLEQASQGGGSPASVSNGSAGSQVVQYSVLLDVDNPDGALMAEMTTQVFFVAGTASQVLTVPLAALDDGDGLRLARVLTGDGKVEQRQVRTGLSDRLRVQVLDGLSEGERLVIGAPAVSGG
ncbi:TPA: efflux RND transporter periplasmic adaptor subunit [Pseudomonas putida]|nr:MULTISPECIES: efflux RND transporter periplasmic adaptor subunit [Pseudomonas]APF01683.1 efflux transporter periplasmic adaptor subunit [Pseudomonas putida]MBP0707286.1 efflux RND transporter periplasmic adaptor subunit [Pseudomonas sp. T34]MCE0999260.1 efflux RND transporter periplasmic adaptor subunit [Pseudomonas sp. NMI1173_11]MCK2186726.1 efflux RND transporter periplasmic adaptor subunit [Pseudomonas sp. MB04B]MDD2083167.1 efflux RND transporter periplasmic adaptor subunit [Pseudomona